MARTFSIKKCIGKIAVQLKLHRESEIARRNTSVTKWKLSEIPR